MSVYQETAAMRRRVEQWAALFERVSDACVSRDDIGRLMTLHQAMDSVMMALDNAIKTAEDPWMSQPTQSVSA